MMTFKMNDVRTACVLIYAVSKEYVCQTLKFGNLINICAAYIWVTFFKIL